MVFELSFEDWAELTKYHTASKNNFSGLQLVLYLLAFESKK